MGEFRSNLNKPQIQLPPWIARVSENATESVARWEELKVETVGVAHIIKVGGLFMIFNNLFMRNILITSTNRILYT